MSGGSMNFAFLDINNAANEIQRTLEEYIRLRDCGVFVQPCDCDIKNYPEAKNLHTPEALTDAVISRLGLCLTLVRKAAVCALRVECLTSRDDGEACFCISLDRDLENVEKIGSGDTV